MISLTATTCIRLVDSTQKTFASIANLRLITQHSREFEQSRIGFPSHTLVYNAHPQWCATEDIIAVMEQRLEWVSQENVFQHSSLRLTETLINKIIMLRMMIIPKPLLKRHYISKIYCLGCCMGRGINFGSNETMLHAKQP